ncbi:MAG: hypothetical protein LBQ50_06795 [Planctomycetaceae bacterium]|nr:hypothetical protein [Planctomycetaceae bacterium]
MAESNWTPRKRIGMPATLYWKNKRTRYCTLPCRITSGNEILTTGNELPAAIRREKAVNFLSR